MPQDPETTAKKAAPELQSTLPNQAGPRAGVETNFVGRVAPSHGSPANRMPQIGKPQFPTGPTGEMSEGTAKARETSSELEVPQLGELERDGTGLDLEKGRTETASSKPSDDYLSKR